MTWTPITLFLALALGELVLVNIASGLSRRAERRARKRFLERRARGLWALDPSTLRPEAPAPKKSGPEWRKKYLERPIGGLWVLERSTPRPEAPAPKKGGPA